MNLKMLNMDLLQDTVSVGKTSLVIELIRKHLRKNMQKFIKKFVNLQQVEDLILRRINNYGNNNKFKKSII